jgi:Tol biopolymer transport system component
LLFVRQGILLRQRFDPAKLQVSGDPIPIAEGINVINNIVAFSVSNNGVLAYRSGGSGGDVALAWLDRSGKLIETVGTPGPYRGVEVSPDGKRIAVHRHDPNGGDIWAFESSRGPMSRQTFDPLRDNSSPVWSPDGTRIAFGAVRDGKWAIFEKAINGGAEELLFESTLNSAPMSWSPDGKFLVMRVVDNNGDQWVLPLNDKKATPLLHDPGNELRGQISPDGKWIAYESNETGRPEIYLKTFPAGEGKRQISAYGGTAPRWRGDGMELFFMTVGSKIASVKITAAGSSLNFSAPTELFDSGYFPLNHSGGSFHVYAVSPDGKRFLIPRPDSASSTDAGAAPITVIVDWFATLK